jgi:outer membrane receptor protein involved in Fe transport
LGATLATGVASPALAQSPDPSAERPDSRPAADSDDVVVTAQKREQRLDDVPVTVTAITGARMAQLGVNSLSEVAAYIPGLQIQEQSANVPGFVIRGITSDTGSAQQGARVTVYYDGVDISRARGAYQDLFDLERIEVVKGPQATLFGTAASVGAISLVSARPRPGTSGALALTYGNFNRTQVSGYLNAGNDTIAARLAFAYKYHDGFVRNIAGDPNVPNQNQGKVDQDDLNGQDQRGVRGSLRWTPNGSVTADLVLTYDGQRNPGTAFKSRVFAPTGGQTGDYGTAELSGSPYSQSVLGAARLGLHRDVYDANLTVAVDVAPGVRFTTVNGYRRFNAREVFDADGGPAWYIELADQAKGDQWSHEGRFTFDGPKYHASFGWNAFFENGSERIPFSTEEGTYLSCAVSPMFVPVQAILAANGVSGCVAPNGTISAARATAVLSRGRVTQQPYASWFENFGRNNTYSMFADATWIPTPRLELTAGARVLIEDRQSGYAAVQPNSVLLAALGVNVGLLGLATTNGVKFQAEHSFAAVLPRANLLFRINDRINLYATISKGRRSPVVQLAAASATVPAETIVPQEVVWNYEAGIKGRAGRFSGAASVFYQAYDGFQVSVQQADSRYVTQSAGSARNVGVELEGNFRASRTLTAFATFSYLDGGIADTPAGTFAGNRFRLQPAVTASGGIDFRLPLGSGATLYVTPNASYRSKVFFELPNSEAISHVGYTLVHARAGVELAGGRYRIGGFARNLLNRHYLIDGGNTGASFGAPTFIAGEPRLYGVELAGSF